MQSLATSPTFFNSTSSPLQSSSTTRVGVVVTAAKGSDLHRWCLYPPGVPSSSEYPTKDKSLEKTAHAKDSHHEEGEGRIGEGGKEWAKSFEWVALETVENAHEVGVSTIHLFL